MDCRMAEAVSERCRSPMARIFAAAVRSWIWAGPVLELAGSAGSSMPEVKSDSTEAQTRWRSRRDGVRHFDRWSIRRVLVR
jgi:hypothetical protein